MWIPIFSTGWPTRRGDWLLMPVTVPLTLLLLFVIACVIPITTPLASLARAAKKRRTQRRIQSIEENLRRQNRLLDWSEVVPKLSAGEGSLIVFHWLALGADEEIEVEEWSIAHHYQVWWTALKPSELEPSPVWLDRSGNMGGFYSMEASPQSTFATRYFDLDVGIATYIRSPEFSHAADEFTPTYYARRFPLATIIFVFPL